MRALSLWRPWPWSFTSADKRIENRPWEITFRGEVVFHAAKRFDHSAVPFIQRAARAGGFDGVCSGYSDAHPAGVLVFAARIVDCVPIATFESELLLHGFDPSFVERQKAWAFGPWCAVLDDVRACDPIPWKGAQGWFHVPDEIVTEALAA